MKENYIEPIRSDLYKKISAIVKRLKIEKTDNDHYDHSSAIYDLEKMFNEHKIIT
jgi:hypothetical protein